MTEKKIEIDDMGTKESHLYIAIPCTMNFLELCFQMHGCHNKITCGSITSLKGNGERWQLCLCLHKFHARNDMGPS